MQLDCRLFAYPSLSPSSSPYPAFSRPPPAPVDGHGRQKHVVELNEQENGECTDYSLQGMYKDIKNTQAAEAWFYQTCAEFGFL